MTSPATAGPVLHAIRAPRRLSSTEAVAWFTAATPPGLRVVGYALSPRAATWMVIGPDGVVEHVTETRNLLTEAYELLLFDGKRELRWLRTPTDEHGTTVALGENPKTLPAGVHVAGHARLHRSAAADTLPYRSDVQIRMLAGVPTAHARPGWTTLRSNRYSPAHVPVTCPVNHVLTVETVEYLLEDDHGNVDVVDTRTLGLSAVPRETLRSQTESRAERTAS